MPKTPDPENSQNDFAWRVHSYTNEYIRFGDAKAGAVLTFCSGLIAVLFALKAHLHFTQAKFVADYSVSASLLATGSLLAFVLLSAAVVCAGMAFLPRLRSNESSAGHEKGLIYWENVRKYANGQEYANAILELPSDKAVTQIAAHVYVLGEIASAKFSWIKWSMLIGALGSMLAGAVALFTV